MNKSFPLPRWTFGLICMLSLSLTLTLAPRLASAGDPSAAAGGYGSLAVKSDGTVWAWGHNDASQLGNGSTTDLDTPTEISNLTSISQVAIGTQHAAALATDGTLQAWGNNTYGQVGDGTTISRTTPVSISSLTGITAIAAGDYHTLALKSDGTVYAWGENTHGQLGNGTTTDGATPTLISGLTNITAIAAGYGHSFAVTASGSVYAWGENDQGQLGDGTTTARSTPVLISSLSDITAIATGSGHTLALDEDGNVYSWGDNEYGQLGSGSTSDNTSPTQISSLSGITALAAGANHSLAIDSDGDLRVWGANSAGQLGNSATTDATTPVELSSPSDVAVIAAGALHSLIIDSDGAAQSWGDNEYGQLGNGSTTDSTSPVQVLALTEFNPSSVSAGYDHSVALKSDGTVWAWGGNKYGQLGDGTNTDQTSPVQITSLTDVTAVAAGGYYSMALLSDGSVYAWGRNNYGQLGDGTTTNQASPVAVSELDDISGIAAGNYHSMALEENGTLYGWGRNYYGQLGDGTTTDSLIPVQITDLSNVTAVAAGFYHTLALKTNGTLWGWGLNRFSQIGNDSTTDATSPTQLTSIADVTALTSGSVHAFALKSTGSIWGWGYNKHGQLGDNTTTTATTPTQVSTLSSTTITALAAGYEHTLALDSDSKVWAWGNNDDGQLGDGTTTTSGTPAEMTALSNITHISANGSHSLALDSSADLWAWGDNGSGQLGDRSTTDRSTPVQVQVLGSFNTYADSDSDGYLDNVDNCADDANTDQADEDGDGIGDVCDPVNDLDPPAFDDVAESHWAYDEIETLAFSGITSGCDSDNYCPDTTLSRAEMAIFLLRSQYGSDYSPASASGTLFSDISSSYWAAAYVEQLATLGITSGCEEGLFCPGREITRAEMAIFILRTKYGSDYQPSSASGTVYGDISSDYWAAAYIEQLYNDGFADDTIEPGRECGDGYFCPSLTVNRGEMAAFLVQAFSLDSGVEASSVSDTVAGGDSLTLSGAGTGSDLSYAWSQLSGTSVTLIPSGNSATFTAPDVSQSDTLTFLLTVTGANGVTDTDQIEITITPDTSSYTEVGGQVGWDPVVGASVTIYDATGETTLGSDTTDSDGHYSYWIANTLLADGFQVHSDNGTVDGSNYTEEPKALYGADDDATAANVTPLTTLVFEMAEEIGGDDLVDDRDTVLTTLDNLGLVDSADWSDIEPDGVATEAILTRVRAVEMDSWISDLISDLTDSDLTLDSQRFFPNAHDGILPVTFANSDNSITILPGDVIEQTLNVERISGSGSGYQYALSSAPDGLTLSSSGVINYASDADAAAQTLTFKATIQDSSSGLGRTLSGTIEIVTTETVITGTLDATGGELTDEWAEARINLPSGALTQSGTVKLVRGEDADGNYLYRLEADETLQSPATLELPDPNFMTAVDTDESESETAKRASSDDWDQWKRYPSWYLTLLDGVNATNRTLHNLEEQPEWPGLTRTHFQLEGSSLWSQCGSVADFSESACSYWAPVLFVSGGPLDQNLGGGEALWGQMAELIHNAGYGVWEFDWRANGPFQDLAGDLADAIHEITTVTNQKVHLVAHGMGGILSRTYLQGLAKDNVGEAISYRSDIASLVTLGTPHSGLFTTETTLDGELFPQGLED
ncbi:MAG: S-layer homology domain-containing protein, partial [Magnetococcales bacterium]|nr:S-layer homology domain-containing protein [Magnetococcales bacterium]